MLCCVLVLVGCGNVGDPLPPLIQIPKSVIDLRAVQIGKVIRLSFTLPSTNTDGSKATTLAVVEIHKAIFAQPVSPDLVFKRFQESTQIWKTLNEGEIAGIQQAERLVLVDQIAETNFSAALTNEFAYAVRVFNQKKQNAGFSNLVRVTISLVPLAPENLRAELGEHFITLRWDSPIENNDGSRVESEPTYNVFRSLQSGESSDTPINSKPVSDPRYTDNSTELGKTYRYTVRSVAAGTSGIVESESSKPLVVTNADTYPPAAPTDLSAASNGREISLVWSPNKEPDLAGYLVYRSGMDHVFQRLHPEIILTTSNVDNTVQKGETYFYRVKAVDLKGNESDLSEEVSETVQ